MTITGSDTICFNGLSEVTQDFSVDILADVPDLPYNLEGSWSNFIKCSICYRGLPE